MTNNFDAAAVAEQLKEQTKKIRNVVYNNGRSRLDKFKDELLALKKEGTSNAELQRWLRYKKRTKVALSTVQRWIAKNG